jgi:formate/nitrite transporter FocA (FNT family)
MSEESLKQEAERQHDRKVVERQALGARSVHDALLLEGEEEIGRHWSGLAWSGLASGISMGLSLVAQGVLRHHLPDTSWRKLIVSAGYSVGFIAVTLGRQQLYTETTLTAFLPFLHHRRLEVFGKVARLWLVVLAANLVGAFLFAWAAAWTTTFDADLSRTFSELGAEQLRFDVPTAFVKGIFGGWMIALMVWLLPAADTARISVIAAITFCLAAADLTHIIAGSLEGFYAVLTGYATLGTYVVHYGIPVLFGNSIGGLVFVAALNHAQVRAGDES